MSSCMNARTLGCVCMNEANCEASYLLEVFKSAINVDMLSELNSK